MVATCKLTNKTYYFVESDLRYRIDNFNFPCLIESQRKRAATTHSPNGGKEVQPTSASSYGRWLPGKQILVLLPLFFSLCFCKIPSQYTIRFKSSVVKNKRITNQGLKECWEMWFYTTERHKLGLH